MNSLPAIQRMNAAVDSAALKRSSKTRTIDHKWQFEWDGWVAVITPLELIDEKIEFVLAVTGISYGPGQREVHRYKLTLPDGGTHLGTQEEITTILREHGMDSEPGKLKKVFNVIQEG